MGNQEIREPIQKRSIEKKQKIIKFGFDLICEKGYHNTNTAEIAKAAGVSTGIVYQYFEDKKDILLQGLEQYSKDLLFPINNLANREITNLEYEIRYVLNECIKTHKISETAHEEIYSLKHTDPDVAKIFFDQEIEATNNLINILKSNNINPENLKEKAHIIISLVDSLCHEIVYHKHSEMNYDSMKNIVVKTIIDMLDDKI